MNWPNDSSATARTTIASNSSHGGRYVGRFAPSPTGPLHIGSLTSAVASYLHARQANGEWLVRIEDIDPPREVAGASDRILAALEALDLHWDRSVLYQSSRLEAYAGAAQGLLDSGLAYHCSCSRRQLRTQGATRYPGRCRTRTTHRGPTALRVRVDDAEEAYVDALQGVVRNTLHESTGDFVIMRRDGLPAYHLAVVLDDAFQDVTTIVRGIDLLDTTAAHRHLRRLLKLPDPRYLHLPVIVNALDQKLSKQTGARGVDSGSPAELAATALDYLGASVPGDLRGARPAHLWQWAQRHWSIASLKGLRSIREH